jgi:hypothetical protein
MVFSVGLENTMMEREDETVGGGVLVDFMGTAQGLPHVSV